MLMRPLKDIRGGRAAVSAPLGAPLAGWNTRDSIDAMSPRDAIICDNAFPGRTGVDSRPGYTSHCDTGEDAAVGTLREYEFGATHKLLAAVNGKIFDVTTSSASSLKTGLDTTAVYFSTAIMGGTMFWANGVDNLQAYNGSTISDATFTGLTLSDINYIHAHKSRIYVIEKDTQSFWYGGTEAISGALTEFDLSLTGSFRGNLKLITSISRDGGAGPDDFIVFIFESGDAVVYSGSNPGDANNWARVGIFRLGRPLSRLGVLQADDEVYILTDRGYEPLSAVLPIGRSATSRNLISDRIGPAVLAAINVVGPSDAWQMCLYPFGEMLIVNIPFGTSTTHQHVMNITTGAWARWKMPQLAQSWSLYGSDIYFGDSGGVIYQFDNGAKTDNGAPVLYDVQQAFSYLGRRNQNKKLNLVRPIIVTSILPPLRLGVNADFKVVSRGNPLSAGGSQTAYIWDDSSSVWDVATWSGERAARDGWYKKNALGYCLSLRLTLSVSQDKVSWTSTNFLYEPGGLIR